MIGGGGLDTFDGGPDFDTILFRGTSGNDIIQAIQTAPRHVVHTVLDQLRMLPSTGGTQTDTFTNTERVRIEAGDGDDTILRVSVSDALDADRPTPACCSISTAARPFVRDRLAVIDDGADDLSIYRKGEDDTTGTSPSARQRRAVRFRLQRHRVRTKSWTS